ncbi:PEGA domain-containing protein [Treponema primitia]|uniref:PEGA domain-containing protein n=1 Tax=Treponema primitia TaxID=88058 RepID=UPI000255559C|nr:PEGA domain-containing protein [Treponema primitia]
MNRIQLFPVLLIGLLCITADPVMGDSIEEIAGKGLVVRSAPSMSKVFINGIERGLTPLTLENIPQGEYDIRLEKDGYAERRIWVSIRENSRLEISLNLGEILGTLILDIDRAAGSPPPEKMALNPEITVEGITQTDPVFSLPVGYRAVRIRAFGWEEAIHSVYILQDAIQRLKVEMRPASFSMTGAELSRARFNPANSGSLGITEFSFNVSGPGDGRINITNEQGDLVFARDLGPFTTWSQSTAWNGRSSDGTPLPDGTYKVLLLTESMLRDTSAPVERRAEMTIRIDSSMNIYPLSSSGASSGLFFSPLPEILPRGSFQIDGSMLFGRAAAAGDAWDALPFAASLRFSPLERLEMTAALNVTPFFDGGAVAGFGGTLKGVFKKARAESPLGLAMGLSYVWADEGTLTPFGTAIGAGLSLPLSWRLGTALSLALSPEILWTGEKGYPDDPAPRALLSGGLLIQQSFFTAGLSLRSEYIFSGTSMDFGPLMAAAEIRFFPPPSSMVFSLLGGGWLENSQAGGFGGIGIGLIY